MRVEKLRTLGVNMSAFDDFDTSGIAGTTMQDALNFEAARWLARRIPHNIEIAWDDYQEDYEAERAIGNDLAALYPSARRRRRLPKPTFPGAAGSMPHEAVSATSNG